MNNIIGFIYRYKKIFKVVIVMYLIEFFCEAFSIIYENNIHIVSICDIVMALSLFSVLIIFTLKIKNKKVKMILCTSEIVLCIISVIKIVVAWVN